MDFSTNNFLKKKSFFISLTFSLLLSIFIYSNFYKFDYLNGFQDIFFFSLIILFTLSTTIIFFILRRIYHLYENFKLQKTGQELQKKILLIFASIVMTPTLLIAFFSIFIFDTALSGWFNKKISTAISQSVKIANQYLDEHQSAMRGDILELVNVINSNSNSLSSDKQKFNKFLDKYTLNNNLSEAVVIDSIGNVLAFSQFVFEYTYADIPPEYYNLANNNEIIISKEENSNKLRAFIKLSQFVDAYLLITRFVDEKVLSAIESTSIAASDYQSIELKTLDIKISFIVIFILIFFF
jgi:two-component system nitrogen regulation sensor histidine kinase NtrY